MKNEVINYLEKIKGLQPELNTERTPENKEAFDRGFRLVWSAVYNRFNERIK